MRVFSFFIFQLLLANFVQAQTPSELRNDSAERTLRENWQELQTHPDESALQNFKTKYFLKDIADQYWLSIQNKKDPSQPSEDVFASAHYARHLLASQPFNVTDWLKAYFQYFARLWQRPFDGATEISKWIMLFAPPFLFALFILLLMYLWIWSPAIERDLPAFMKSRSPLIVMGGLSTFALMTLLTGQWLIACHLLLIAYALYNRKFKSAVPAIVLSAAVITMAPFLQMGIETFHHLSALEALEKGRTRVEYSPQSIALLEPNEKAQWIYWNGDHARARQLLEKSTPSKSRDILLVNMGSKEKTASQLLEQYESLQAKYSDDPVIFYNLAFLYIRTQNLVKGDTFREKLGKDYNTFSEHAQFRNQELLDPVVPHAKAFLFSTFQKKFNHWLQTNGLNPLQPAQAFSFLIYFLLPWFAVLLAFSSRNKTSGVCDMTGESTSAASQATSALYMSLQVRTDTGSTGSRKQLDDLARSHARRQQKRVGWLGFFIPSASSLMREKRITDALIWLSVFFFFIWAGLSGDQRSEILWQAGVRGSSFSTGDEFMFPSATALWAVAFVVYIGIVMTNRRKAGS